jgi:hypothetical protein
MVMPQEREKNVSDRCPEWVLPSRRWAWRATIVLCVAFWAGVIGAVVALAA